MPPLLFYSMRIHPDSPDKSIVLPFVLHLHFDDNMGIALAFTASLLYLCEVNIILL